LFKFRTTLHGHWPVSQGPRIDTYYKGANPQYYLRLDGSLATGTFGASAASAPSSSVVWILLTRHVNSVEEDKAEGADDDDTYLTLHVHRWAG
jgi:hypothetical protein